MIFNSTQVRVLLIIFFYLFILCQAMITLLTRDMFGSQKCAILL